MIIDPYVGVTGITSIDDVEKVNRAFESFRSLTPHKSMAGILVRNRILISREPEEPGRFVDDHRLLCPLLSALKTDLKSIHYCSGSDADFNINNVYEILDLNSSFPSYDMRYIVNSIQLNIDCWPRPVDMQRLARRQYGRALAIILQVTPNMLGPRGMSFHDLSRRMRTYGDAVQYYMFDSSRGQGKEIDPPGIYAAASMAEMWDGIVLAGGLGGDNVEKIIGMARITVGDGNFSVDAESKLRTDDVLDEAKVSAYLEAAYRGFEVIHENRH